MEAAIYDCFGRDIGTHILSFCIYTWEIVYRCPQWRRLCGRGLASIHYDGDNFLGCQHLYINIPDDRLTIDVFFATRSHPPNLLLHSISIRIASIGLHSAQDTFSIALNGEMVVNNHCGHLSCRDWSPEECRKHFLYNLS